MGALIPMVVVDGSVALGCNTVAYDLNRSVLHRSDSGLLQRVRDLTKPVGVMMRDSLLVVHRPM